MTDRRLEWQSRLLVAALIPAAVLLSAVRSAVRRARIRQTGLRQTSFLKTRADRRVVVVSLAAGAGAWAARAATPPAALAGSILASAMILGTAPETITGGNHEGRFRAVDWIRSPLPPLSTLILLTLVATRYRRKEKKKPELHGRNTSQITANLGIATLAAALPDFRGSIHAAGLARTAALVAALSEATADTLSSEFGEVLGGMPRLITTGRPAPAGTDGAVSLVGSLAGAAGAATVILAALPALAGARPDQPRTDPRVALSALATGVGAMAGLFFDSLLGATVEQRGWLNNDAVNFLSTAVAAVIAARLTHGAENCGVEVAEVANQPG